VVTADDRVCNQYSDMLELKLGRGVNWSIE